MEINGKITFWELLNEFSIRIPVIQRDYAQGRNNVKDIRDNFLDSIKVAFKTQTELDLNFVYGSVSNDIFTPIDGQQRLTTLYLIHVYFLLSLGKDVNNRRYSRIKKFTYETRTTSRDFCKCLTSKSLIIRNNKAIKEIDSISKEIVNNNWFCSSWINDPTIISMLNMLDSIHNQFRNENILQMFELLTGDIDDCPLYFYFLDLREYNLGDSIYIKLNARGKDLTCYENFKAKLTKYINDELDSCHDDYIAKLDGKWADVFWEYKNPETKLFDDKILSLFINYLINEYAAYMVTAGRDAVREEIKEIIGYSQLEFINRFQDFNNKWDGHKVINSILNIFKLFDLVTDGNKQICFVPNNKYFKESEVFNWIIQSHDSDYENRIIADAYLGFILKNESKISNTDEFCEKLTEWMRVMTVLSRETNYNGGDDYTRAISKGVRKLLPFSYDIINHLSNITEYSGYGFDSDCFEEECLKAKLIIRDNEWKELVLKAEDNKYFNGQIGFLFEATGILKTYENQSIDCWSEMDDKQYKDSFKSYFRIFDSIFGQFEYSDTHQIYIGINREFANSFRRALLCKGDYLLNVSSNSSFLVDNHRDASWKRLLRIQSNDIYDTYKTKRKLLFDLIEDSDFDTNNIALGLEKICKRDIDSITDWRRYFISIPEIMETLHDYSSNKPNEKFIRFEGDNIFLMGSSRLYGYNYEYYSYALFCKIKETNRYEIEYYCAKGWEEIPYQIKATNKINRDTFEIKYRRFDKVYVINNIKDKQYEEYSLEDAFSRIELLAKV